jgi:hypothetical protein
MQYIVWTLLADRCRYFVLQNELGLVHLWQEDIDQISVGLISKNPRVMMLSCALTAATRSHCNLEPKLTNVLIDDSEGRIDTLLFVMQPGSINGHLQKKSRSVLREFVSRP